MSKTKKSTLHGAGHRQTQPRPKISKTFALEILQSAISYLQQSGFEIQAENTSAGLMLFVENARCNQAVNGTVNLYAVAANGNLLTALQGANNGNAINNN